MPTIDGAVAHHARRVPHRQALIDGELCWTWAQLEASVRRVAGALTAAGLQRGDRLALMSANSGEQVVAILATLRVGGVVASINTRSTAAEVAYMVQDCGATRVLASDELFPVVEAAKGGGSGPEHLRLSELYLTDFEGPGVLAGTSCVDDNAFIVYTSGTTGRPKGVLLDHQRAVAASTAQIMSMGLRDGERWMHLSPMYHAGAITFLVAVTILGGTHVLLPVFDAAAAVELLEREKVNAFLGVPMMLQAMVEEPTLVARDLSTWRTALVGGAMVPAHTISRLLDLVPGVELFQMCGQTESGPAGLYSYGEQMRARPDSTGHQAEVGYEARVVGPDGADVKPGQTGELLLRGDGIMKGYWNKPEATAEVLRDGWLHTGDVIRVDPDGAFVLIDRIKDVIIASNGVNIYSAEIEQVLSSHPDVADCAIIGVNDEQYGATVAAVVAPRAGAEVTLESIRAHCSSHLASYKLPRKLFCAEIPRNPSGKIQKHILRAQIDSLTAEVG
jgi:fatty-acyl-CoA synthase